MNKNMVSKKIPEYIPLNYNDLNSCIKAEYNYKNKVANLQGCKANLASLFSWKDVEKENEIEFISKFILANHRIII